MLKFGHFNAVFDANIDETTRPQLISVALEIFAHKKDHILSKFRPQYDAFSAEQIRRYGTRTPPPMSVLDQVIDSLNNSLYSSSDAFKLGSHLGLEHMIRVIEKRPSYRVQEHIISGLLCSDREDAISIFKHIYPLLDEEILNPDDFNYFYINCKQLFRLLQDSELVSMIRNSPIKVKINQGDLQNMLNDDKVFAEAFRLRSAGISEFLGRIYNENCMPKRVSVEMTSRFLKLTNPEDVPAALRFEMQILAAFWDEFENNELMAMGYLELWQELHPESLETVAVDDGRDLSHISLPFTEEYGQYFTEERRAMVRKLALLVDEMRDEDLPVDIVLGIFLD